MSRGFRLFWGQVISLISKTSWACPLSGRAFRSARHFASIAHAGITTPMTLKQKIHAHYLQLVQDRIDAFGDMIRELTDGAQNDAKGSAGDKHETALSMMHIEQERLTAKLREFIDQKSILEKIDPTATHGRVALGSLVKANGILLFVSAALPKINIDETTILAVSLQSPLGQKLIGCEKGYQFELSSTNYRIQSVE